MPSINNCVLCGHIGRDPEMRQSASGVGVCNLTIAVNEYDGKDEAGKAKERAVWCRVRVIGRQAEWVARGRKGDVLLIAGAKYLVDEVPDKNEEGGVKRFHYFLVTNTGNAAVFPRNAGQTAKPADAEAKQESGNDDKLPF